MAASTSWSWIGTLSPGGLAGSTGGVDASIDALYLAPATTGAGDAGAHLGRRELSPLSQIQDASQ